MKIQKLKYQKLNSDIKLELNEIYKKAIYPQRKQLKLVAKKYQLKLTKVENWFKYKRRSEYKKGLLVDQPKKWFAHDKLQFLLEKFEENETPTPLQYQEYSNALNANYSHVKNWFAHQRQKKRMNKMPTTNQQKELNSLQQTQTEPDKLINANESQFDQKSQVSEKEQEIQEEQKQELNSFMSTPKITIEKIHQTENTEKEKFNINFDQAQTKPLEQQNILNCQFQNNNAPSINILLQSLHQNQEAYKQLNSFIWFRNQMMISKENYLKHLQSQYIKEAIEKINLYNCIQQYSQIQSMKNYFF